MIKQDEQQQANKSLDFMNDTNAIIGDVKRTAKQVNVRLIITIFIILFAILSDVLIDYINTGFDVSILSEPKYWIELVITCASVVMVTLASRSYAREKELSRNKDVKLFKRLLGIAELEISKNNLVAKLNEYIDEANKQRRIKAYKQYLNYKAVREKDSTKKTAYLQRIAEAEKDIDCYPCQHGKIKIGTLKRLKYTPLNRSVIFSLADVQGGNEQSLEIKEGQHISGLLTSKVSLIIAFGLSFSTLIFGTGDFTVGLLVSTCLKIVRTVMAVNCGVGDGITFVRGTITAKLRARYNVLQAFFESEKQADIIAELATENEKALKE